jgi:hypothetical protein
LGFCTGTLRVQLCASVAIMTPWPLVRDVFATSRARKPAKPCAAPRSLARIDQSCHGALRIRPAGAAARPGSLHPAGPILVIKH